MANFSIVNSLTAPGGVNVGSTESLSATGYNVIDAEVLGATATNVIFAAAFAVAQLKAFAIISTVDCTINTNANSGDDVIELVGGQSLLWSLASGFDCPFTTDVTDLRITNDTSPDAAGTISAVFVTDPTP